MDSKMMQDLFEYDNYDLSDYWEHQILLPDYIWHDYTPPQGWEQWYADHACCPKCGATQYNTFCDDEVYRFPGDNRYSLCYCGWQGRIPQRVPAKPEEPVEWAKDGF